MKKEIMISILACSLVFVGCDKNEENNVEKNNSVETKKVEYKEDYTIRIKNAIKQNKEYAEKIGDTSLYTVPVDINNTKEFLREQESKSYELAKIYNAPNLKCNSDFAKAEIEKILSLRGYKNNGRYVGFDTISINEFSEHSDCVFIDLNTNPAFNRNHKYSIYDDGTFGVKINFDNF